MADGFIQFVLRNLNSFIQSELGLLFGVDEQMKKLSSTLSAIQAVLDDAEQRKHKDKAVQDWLRKLKDAAYEIDDILDDCATQAPQREYQTQNSSTLKKVSTSLLTGNPVEIIRFRHKIGNRMKKVTKMLDAIEKEKTGFHLSQAVLVDRASFDESRETISLLTQPQLFGREEEKGKIVKMLVEHVRDFEKVSFYAIVGMGGLGKTTLAQMVFNDDRVELHFERKIWVYVSQDFDVKRVLETIIESVSGDSCKVSNLDSVWKKVRELLDGKRYLLVLDDVWDDNQERWNTLKYGLACGVEGSSVVITTRLGTVASVVTTEQKVLLLSFFSAEDCWLLFRQCAFGHGNEERPNLVTIGKEIVKKCGGVPLAAKALGGLMRFKREEKEWHSIKDSQIWSLTEDESLIMPALKLSYYDLPLELRRCFAYCAVFVKGLPIEKENLIYHWMANGFISPNEKLDVEDLGNGIWNELCWRSFFQDVEERRSGVTTFRMHDLMHDLAQSVMEDECHVMETESSSNVSNPKIRYVTLLADYKKDYVFPKALHKVESVRTIQRQFRQPNNIYGNFRTEFTCDFTNFGSLRVFDGMGLGMLQLSNSIGNSKHLRYLNLSWASIQTLPKSICSLHNLQTLNLNYCRKLQKLPENMKDLRSLRHLYLKECNRIRHTPPKLGQLTNLKTLSFFVVGKSRGCRLAELKDLDLGGELHIRCLGNVRNLTDAQQSNLVKKQSLRILKLSWEDENASKWQTESQANVEQLIEALEPHPNVEELAINNYRGARFPHWMRYSILQNIGKIELYNCRNCLVLPAFGQLPSLRFLIIKGMDYVEYIDNDFPDGGPIRGFPSLEELRITGMRNLKGLSREEGIDLLPRLRTIDIFNCPKLILPHLSSPKKLEVAYCGNVLLSSISNLDGLTSLLVEDINDVISFPEDTFQNLSALQSLEIEWCTNLQKLPESLASLVSLLSLHIRGCDELLNCENCLVLPAFGQLPSLRFLSIEGMDYVEYIDNDFPDGGPVRGFPSLEQLHIDGMRNLKGLSREEGIDLLPRLREIEIKNCPELILPHLSSPEELEVWNCGNVLLLSSISNLDGLTSLSVYNMEDVISFPEDTFQNLSALQSLEIERCRNLQKLPESLASLVSLQSLNIWGCHELESLTESLGNLTSLQSLKIGDCRNIPSIPHSFQNLTKLETLFIRGCGPELKRRCQKEIGEDWCKIAHIPRVSVH